MGDQGGEGEEGQVDEQGCYCSNLPTAIAMAINACYLNNGQAPALRLRV